MFHARITATGVLIALTSFRGELIGGGLALVSTVGLLVSLLAIGLISKMSALRVWSSGFWYLALLILFHLGMAIPLAHGYEVSGQYGAYIATWFDTGSHRIEAVYLSTLAVAAATVGYLCAHRRSTPPEDRIRSTGVEGVLGAFFTIGGSSLVLGYVAVTQPSALLGISRGAYWATVATSGVDAIGGFIVTFGGILLACAVPSRARTAGLTALAIFGAWVLVVGARGLIMYTILAMLIVVARLRPMPRNRVAAMVLVGGLAVMSLVGFIRTDGLGNAEVGASAANPVNGVVEMGGSIRPLIENVTYARSYNEGPSKGATYTGWITRAIDTVLGMPAPPDTEDLRIAGNETRQRVEIYQIGYSAVAEAFRNWRTPGVIGVFALFGLLLGRVDGWRLGHSLPAAYSGVVFFALIYHLRQPSVQLVPLLLVGGLLVWSCALLGSRQDARHYAASRASHLGNADPIKRKGLRPSGGCGGDSTASAAPKAGVASPSPPPSSLGTRREPTAEAGDGH